MLATEQKIHKFEAAGLGKAPFRYVGMEEKKFVAAPGCPAQPGGTCGYCSNGIMYLFHVVSADGKRFHVGCDCILKVGDEGLKRVIQNDVRRLERERRHAKQDAKIAEGRAWVEANRPRLAALDAMVVRPAVATRGDQTLEQAVDWYLRCAGRSGTLRMLAAARKAVEATQ